MLETTIKNSNAPIWNYETLKDFCGSYYWRHYNSINESLIYNLPIAIDEFAKQESKRNNTSIEEEKTHIIDMVCSLNEYDSPEAMIDHLTGINCKDVIIECLTTGREATDKELAAILDVIYIDNISAELGRIAYEIEAK